MKINTFEAAWIDVHNAVYDFVYYAVGGNKEDALDIMQNTALRGWRYWHSLSDISKTTAWFISISRNEVARFYSKKQKEIGCEIWLLDELLVEAERFEDGVLTKLALFDFLDSLPPVWRSVLTMRYKYGFSVREISKMTSVKVSTIKSRLARTAKLLEKELI